MAKATKTCECCGKQFSLHTSPANIARQKLCSRACSAEMERRVLPWRDFMIARLANRSAKMPNGCVNYTGPHAVYGHIEYKRKTFLAHRVAWQIAHGEIPKRMCICHTCDNPLCVNIDHLFIGTYRDNVQDMIQKGRAQLKGRGDLKITQLDATEIRRLISAGMKQDDIAGRYGISQSMVSMIKTGTRR